MPKLYNFLSLLFCFCTLTIFAQERKSVEGGVFHGNIPLEGVHIKNESSKRVSVSDAEGGFVISLLQGDTLVFSHVGMKDLIKFVKEEELSSGNLQVQMTEKENNLEEVILTEDPDLAVETGIISKRNAPLTVNERKLQAEGGTMPDGRFKFNPTSIPLVPILNAINGRTNELKKNVEVERKLVKIQLLRNQYLEYMLEMCECSRPEIERFLDYVVEQEGLDAVIESKNPRQMEFFLVGLWFQYKER